MSDDRELLMQAAKAAGISPILCYESARNCLHIGDRKRYTLWRPLTDDGDALRLAINLYFHVCVNGGDVEVRADHGTFMEQASDDTYAATRRCITRAAAEIGKGAL